MKDYIDKLSQEETDMIKPWADKWINIGLKTGEIDKARFEKGIRTAYEKANLVFPNRIVYVKSPIVGALAAIIANGVWASKSEAVDRAVNGAVNGAVSEAVDGVVREAVREAVNGAVSEAVDRAVNGAVREAVDRAVNGAVGKYKKLIDYYKLEAKHLINWHYCLGGQFWVGGWYWGNASVSFFIEICKLNVTKDIRERYEAYRDINESVNYVWANKNFIIACERPKTIRRDVTGQLSSDQGKAIEYKDGWGIYALDGVVLKEEMYWRIVSKEMSLSEIMKIEISDQRTVALKYNPQAILKEKAKLIHSDNRTNELYLVENSEINTLTEFPKMYFLKMTCPTGRIFIEGIPPEVAEKTLNATDCQAWTCGLVRSDYEALKLEA